MTNFNIVTPRQFMNELEFQAPIPGEIFTKKRRSLPFDRPPIHPDPSIALEQGFIQMLRPRVARQLLGLLDSRVPVEDITEVLLTNMVAEGVTTPQSAMVMLPALMTIIIRMAQAAKIDFVFRDEGREDPITPEELRIAEIKASEGNKTEKAISAAKKSAKELSSLPKTDKGLLTKPEDIA